MNRKSYDVGCPDLPSCWSQVETEEEALANIRSASKDYLEVVRGKGPIRFGLTQSDLCESFIWLAAMKSGERYAS